MVFVEVQAMTSVTKQAV